MEMFLIFTKTNKDLKLENMEKYDIRTGNLFTDLYTPYCRYGNQIDVYPYIGWTAENEKDYQEKEDFINNWEYEDDLVKAFAWCDIGGYKYWVVQQEEENYVSIDVILKKQPGEYSQEEIQKIRDIIVEGEEKLMYFLM